MVKKLVFAFCIALLVLAALVFIFPGIWFGFPLGQKLMLSLEGEQVASFYFKDEQSSKDTIYMKGVIYSGTHDDINQVFNQYPDITTLVMEDVPGSIDDVVNLKASMEIRKQGINTYVPKDGVIASGGTDMFLAGVERKVHPTAKLGVHSWGTGDDEAKATDLPTDHPEHQKYLEYYRKMEIPEDFYWYTLEAAPAEDIHWMTPQEIIKYKVETIPEPNILALQKTLASDKFNGRRAGENQMAQELIKNNFFQVGLEKFAGDYQQQFTFLDKNKQKTEGTNLVGYVKGQKHPEKYIVIGAHYDHLGVINDTIYNGADDNASGTAALIRLAWYFSKNRPEHSIIFAAFDAEEQGLHGSQFFVDNSPIPISDVVLNINMDMISRNPLNEIYVVGLYEYPKFKPIIDEIAGQSKLKVSYGHDDPSDKSKDYWMYSSDNGPFFEKGIPNITFSEEDHPGYHKPTDDFENINPDFYKNVVQLIQQSIEAIDQTHLD